MATLTVSATTNFSGDALSNIDKIDFTNIFASATAIFAASQFDDVQILTDVLIDGSVGTNRVVVNGGSVDASLWTFAGWSFADSLTFNGSAGADTFTGSTQKESISGGNGNDTIAGSLGNDTLNGGNNIDLLSYAASNAAVTVNLLTGAGSGGHAAGDTLSNFENVTGSAFGDTLTGSDIANVLTGGDGADTIDGEGGDDIIAGGTSLFTLGDTLNGGGGNDVFLYGGSNEVANSGESIDGGVGTDDRIRATAGFTGFQNVTIVNVEIIEFAGGNALFTGSQLGALGSIQNVIGDGISNALQIAGGANVNLAPLLFTNWSANDTIDIIGGTAGADSWIGSSQKDVLSSSGGADSLSGGDGNDVFRFGNSAHVVAGMTIDGGLGAEDKIETFTNGIHDFTNVNLGGVEKLDFVSGSTAKMQLLNLDIGLGGVAFVDGTFAATDEFIVSGGSVNLQTVSFSSWSDAAKITVNGSSGADSLVGANVGRETINAGGGNDTLNGQGGNDELNGDAGNDTLSGGLGNDTFAGGAGTDAANFAAAAGPIAVNLTLGAGQTTGEGFDIFSDIENLTGSGSGDSFTGSIAANRLDGGGGNDTLRGGAGNDTLNGDVGADLIFGDGDNDVIDGAAGIDQINGGAGNDQLFGGADADTLLGSSGIDRLDGGDGADRLFADATADIFFFGGSTGAGDRVFDFLTGVHLLEIDASGFGGVAGSFVFRANANPVAPSATRAMLYDTDDGKLFFDIDGNGAATPIHVLTLVGAPALAAADIDLV